MTISETGLWEKIKRFQFNEPEISFRFEDRLARENGWTKDYTERVIEEYRKFIFLCCISDSGITPSDPVDQAWHLHLTFTKSYWVQLCKETLGKELHHNPTKGGKSEARKFDRYYTSLFTLYKEKFNNDPPTDIWHDNKTRFSDIDFQRVNVQKYWLIKKPSSIFRRVIFPAICCLFGLLFIQAVDTAAITVIIVVIILGVVMTRAYRNNSGNGGSGCGASGCGAGHGGSGCSSGCSGGSGCGGGGCGGGCS